jgi:hypothetical protein
MRRAQNAWRVQPWKSENRNWKIETKEQRGIDAQAIPAKENELEMIS